MSERYFSKREAGISPYRSDGSLTSSETDRQAEAAEEFAADRLGGVFNSEIYSDRGDGGCDFVIGGKTVEVVWLGYTKNTTVPRYSGNLIVNPYEPQRHADIYVVVAGSISRGFSLMGCAKHSDLKSGKDFGYGPKLYLETGNLRPFKSDKT